MTPDSRKAAAIRHADRLHRLYRPASSSAQAARQRPPLRQFNAFIQGRRYARPIYLCWRLPTSRHRLSTLTCPSQTEPCTHKKLMFCEKDLQCKEPPFWNYFYQGVCVKQPGQEVDDVHAPGVSARQLDPEKPTSVLGEWSS